MVTDDIYMEIVLHYGQHRLSGHDHDRCYEQNFTTHELNMNTTKTDPSLKYIRVALKLIIAY